MIYEIIVEVLSAWQVILVGLVVMIVLPLVFYLASFDKKPVRIKKVPVKSVPSKSARKKSPQPDNKAGGGDDEEE